MNFLTYIAILINLSNFKYCNGILLQDLGGHWNLSSVDSEIHIVNVTVPGGVYTDLMNNNIIKDVFFGYNDTETRWVAYQKWIYSTYFIANETLMQHRYVNLVLEGIDTFSEILINDKLIGKTDNMFIRYVFNIRSALKPGSNKIVINFMSPTEKAQELYNEQLKFYEVPPTCVPKEYRGECHVNHIRKMQASFSWDWGPALPSVGIWRPIYIEAYNSSLIRDAVIKTTKNDIAFVWEINLSIYYAPNVDDVKGNLIIELYHDMGHLVVPFDLNISVNNDGDYVSTHTLTLDQDYVKLWWPNGYGNQNLYNIEISYVNSEYNERFRKQYNIGFRVIELMQNELFSYGREFLFKVNGRVIFAKGSNVIPINILPEKENITTIRYLLQSAKDVNMNMLRVWGGGMYESDEFYQIADELGLLIWQDFMFACSMYPTNEDFLASVTQEVKYQVIRLQYHPSIAIWAGNNENEGALRDNWYNTAYNFTLYKKDYVKLYVDIIKETFIKYDNSREFIVSSPTNGIESDEEGYVAKNPGSSFYGDVHFYNYFQNGWNKNIFPTPRFASEYGYQSLPSIKTLMRATSNVSDLEIGSRFLHHRQHHPNGYNEMKFMMNYQFKLNITNKQNFRDAYIFFSQINQAMSIKSETEHYRSFMGILNDSGEGWTYGALYWQLNDVWVAPTWSGIDYYLNWKMLHYYAKDFFAPLIITGRLNTDRSLDIYVVNEYLPIYGAIVFLRVFEWQSFQEVLNQNLTLNIPLDTSTKTGLGIEQVDIFLNNCNCGSLETGKLNCFFILEVQDRNGKTIAPTNYVFPNGLNTSNITKPIIKISSVTQTNGNTFDIEIKTTAITLFVWLESDFRGRFSENGFIQTTPIKVISFRSEDQISLETLKNSLVLTHLFDVKYEQ